MAGMNKKEMEIVRVYTIYKHTLPDGSAYIGMTEKENPKKRYRSGCGYSENLEFHAAIMELGWKQVTTEVLAEVYGNWYEAHSIEVLEINKAAAAGIKLYNKQHIQKPKEYIYNCGGCTIIDINQYFPTFKAAADFIGVTRAAVQTALKEDRACKGWTLVYGDVTNEKNDEETEA